MKIAFSFPVIIGSWMPQPHFEQHQQQHQPYGTIEISNENVVLGDDHRSIQFDIIEFTHNKIVLQNIQVNKKPPDWYNVIKYKKYIDLYHKVRHHGIVCQYTFYDENSVEVRSNINDTLYTFLLTRKK